MIKWLSWLLIGSIAFGAVDFKVASTQNLQRTVTVPLTTQLSIIAFVRPKILQDVAEAIITNANVNGDPTWQFFVNGAANADAGQSGEIGATTYDGAAGVGVYETTGAPLIAGQSQMIGMSVDVSAGAGDRIRVYHNGVKQVVTVQSDSNTTGFWNATTLYVGRRGNNSVPRFCNSIIESIFIWNRRLTQDEFMEVAISKGKNIPLDGLMYNPDFNGKPYDAVTTAIDRSTNGYDVISVNNPIYVPSESP